MTTQLTTETFAKAIQDGVSLIDFGAQWYPPCRMMEPVVEELSKDFDGKATIAQVDVDQSQDLANLFGIRSIPTMVIFKDGKPVDALVGVHPKQTLMEKIQAQLS
ncbi:TPA: thioredoxin [Streptococcus pneumoniae]|nr:thioredoxin [Streptococcus pneumoniae]HEV1802024.1 thioredoxin [Streptococcus pneumoniae]HEV1878744.1 thioredoxin [Streptococcus pneumoniae]